MKSLLTTTIVTVTLLAIWQCMVIVGDIPSYILPSPLEIMIALYQQRNIILLHSLPTLAAMIMGFILGIVLGVSAAILIAFYRKLALWFLPLMIISQAIPTFAIAPLLVIWFGYGLLAKIITTTLMIFFPIISSFYDGLKQTNPAWLALGKAMHGPKWRTFLYVCIPAALPELCSGIRIAAVVAPIGAIVSEWVGSSAGLGYLMLNANARVQIDMMFAVLIVIIALALTLYFTVDRLLRTLVWWK